MPRRKPDVLLELDRYGGLRVLRGRVYIAHGPGVQRICPICTLPTMLSRVYDKRGSPYEEWTCGCTAAVEERTFIQGEVKRDRPARSIRRVSGGMARSRLVQALDAEIAREGGGTPWKG